MRASRMSAEERRESVLDAALAEFARGGLAATSTEAIAARAGISQPYLFRLFPTKKDLFIASLRRTFGRVECRFAEASQALTGAAALEAMGGAYADLLADRDLLLCQLHTYAACGDAEVQAAARACYAHLWRMVQARSGADAGQMRLFFAVGMLCNVAAALDLPAVDEQWARDIMGAKPAGPGPDAGQCPAGPGPNAGCSPAGPGQGAGQVRATGWLS